VWSIDAIVCRLLTFFRTNHRKKAEDGSHHGARRRRAHGSLTPDEAADRVLEGLAAGKFLITTHPMTLSQIQQKAANVDAYVNFLDGTLGERLCLK
jgi:hypothetical protein